MKSTVLSGQAIDPQASLALSPPLVCLLSIPYEDPAASHLSIFTLPGLSGPLIAVPGVMSISGHPLSAGTQSRCPHCRVPLQAAPSPPLLQRKLPINEGESQTQCLAPRPRSWAQSGGVECAGRGIGNKCTGVFSLVDPCPLSTPQPCRCPKFGLLRKRISCLGFP